MSRRVAVYLQSAATDCAAACLLMILTRSGVRATARDVRATLDAGRDGVSALTLRDCAVALGIGVRPHKITDAGDLARVPLPAIAHWDHDHYVVIERVRGNRVRMVDPAVGRREIPIGEARDRLTGIVLLFDIAPQRWPWRPRRIDAAWRRTLVPLLWRVRGRLAAAVAVASLLTLAGLALPLATEKVATGLASGGAVGSSWPLLIATLAAAVGLLAWVRGLLTSRLQLETGAALSAASVGALFGSAYRYVGRRQLGDLAARIASIETVRELLGASLTAAAVDGAVVLGYLATLTWLCPPLGAVGAAVMAGTAAVTARLAARARLVRREELLANADADSTILDTVSGMASVKAIAATDYAMARWRAAFDVALSATWRRARLAGAANALPNAAGAVAPVLLLVLAAHWNPDSLGRALGLAALGAAGVAPIGRLPTHLFTIGELGPQLDRVQDLLDAPNEPTGSVQVNRLAGAIELRGVSFRYDAHSPEVLRHVSLTIQPGTKVGVVGASGCGKSTLIGLLAGLHQPTAGQIVVDGHDLADLELNSLRRRMGVVLQNRYVPGTSIRESITLGRTASDEDVRRAAERACIANDIEALPMGFATPLRGAAPLLSGGQEQRLALARALLREPDLLILDEATSALDPLAEAAVERTLRDLRCTRIVAAHRLSTIIDADLIIVLQHGRLVEAGPPDELERHGGLFAAMVNAQTPHGELPSKCSPKPTPHDLIVQHDLAQSLSAAAGPT